MTDNTKSNQSTYRYLCYLKDHPEVLHNQPSCATEGSVWLKKMLTNQCPTTEAIREMRAIEKRWERYHLKRAESLGFEIDIDDFKRRKGDHFK